MSKFQTRISYKWKTEFHISFCLSFPGYSLFQWFLENILDNFLSKPKCVCEYIYPNKILDLQCRKWKTEMSASIKKKLQLSFW